MVSSKVWFSTQKHEQLQLQALQADILKLLCQLPFVIASMVVSVEVVDLLSENF